MAETSLPLGGRAYNRLVGRLSAEARRTYDLLLDSYYKTAPAKWRDVLTSTQEKRLSIVTDPDEWRVARKALSRGLSEVPVLGVGALSPDHVYVADHRAHTAILDLSNAGTGGLPEDLKTWLADRDIVKLTSNGRDEPLDLEVDLAINTSDVYRSVAMSGRWSILDRSRSFGVESQSAWAVGYHHRRCEESEWKELLGNHKYQGWPTHREASWDPMLDLQSSAHGRFYAFFEANCAMTFCRALLLHGIAYEGTIGNGLDTSRPLREMFPLWLRSAVSTVCVPPLRRTPRWTADRPAARGRSSSDPRDPDTGESELVASTSSWRREALSDMPTVAKIELRSTSEPCDAGAELSNPKWTEEDDLDNPFRFMPTFMSVCSFCGSDRCSRFVRGDDKRINCKKLATHLRTGGKRRRLCEYRRCRSPWDHVTRVCPWLHRRCRACQCRGHAAEDKVCDTRCEATTSRLRRDFESQASSGEYTVLRFSRSEWGFYPPIPRELQPPRPEYLDYAELLLKPALRGLEVVEGLRRERSRLAGKPEDRRKSARIAARLGASDSCRQN